MRIAFYAPLKPPGHPVPSGDRRIARLLLKALRKAGHEVRVVSTFRSYEGLGDRAAQAKIRARGASLVQRLLAGKLRQRRPDLWFTYHLYQKAPDWLGPPIAEALGIPYVVAEAAYAPRRSAGRWDEGLAAVAAALRQADTVLMLNPNDEECVAPLLRRPAAVEPMLPFLNPEPYQRAFRHRATHRTVLARRHRISKSVPWLLAVGMMRPGDKLASFRSLAKALAGLKARSWRLLVVGDGPARKAVRAAFLPLGRRVHWLGARPESELAAINAASDLLVWPAVNEAIGMAILEAQAAGLPVVAGNSGAIGAIVADGETGYLVPEGDPVACRRAIATFLSLPPSERARMSNAAQLKIRVFHEIALAADQLDRVLQGAVARAAKRRKR